MISQRPRITFERTYDAPLAAVWALWTTKEGLESWWGPEGFSVKVHTLELRPGGQLLYAMSATAPEQIEFMKNANMPVTTEAKITFTEVEAQRRLAYQHLTDFIPNVESYFVTTLLELSATATGVRMQLSIDPMHDDVWTERATMGWESELGKLTAAIQKRTAVTSAEGATP